MGSSDPCHLALNATAVNGKSILMNIPQNVFFLSNISKGEIFNQNNGFLHPSPWLVGGGLFMGRGETLLHLVMEDHHQDELPANINFGKFTRSFHHLRTHFVNECDVVMMLNGWLFGE